MFVNVSLTPVYKNLFVELSRILCELYKYTSHSIKKKFFVYCKYTITSTWLSTSPNLDFYKEEKIMYRSSSINTEQIEHCSFVSKSLLGQHNYICILFANNTLFIGRYVIPNTYIMPFIFSPYLYVNTMTIPIEKINELDIPSDCKTVIHEYVKNYL